MRCQACRRPLTNPISLQYGYGPDCLKRAARAGTAPMEALGEMVKLQRSRPKRAVKQPEPVADTFTGDLFDSLRMAAIDDLHKAAEACRLAGIKVELLIDDQLMTGET